MIWGMLLTTAFGSSVSILSVWLLLFVPRLVHLFRFSPYLGKVWNTLGLCSSRHSSMNGLLSAVCDDAVFLGIHQVLHHLIWISQLDRLGSCFCEFPFCFGSSVPHWSRTGIKFCPDGLVRFCASCDVDWEACNSKLKSCNNISSENCAACPALQGLWSASGDYLSLVLDSLIPWQLGSEFSHSLTAGAVAFLGSWLPWILE